jgi:Chromate transporter
VGFEQQTEGCYALRRSDITVHQAYSASAIDANLLLASTLLSRYDSSQNVSRTLRGVKAAKHPRDRGSALEVLRVFLKLGVISFGGPIAHIGYFRDEFVVRRRWLDEPTYADLVALCQFVPGPASSQVGFSIGLMRARYLGGLAAWAGFTLPSALLLVLFAYGAAQWQGSPWVGILHGLKLVAVAIVAQAVPGPLFTFAAYLRRP